MKATVITSKLKIKNIKPCWYGVLLPNANTLYIDKDYSGESNKIENVYFISSKGVINVWA